MRFLALYSGKTYLTDYSIYTRLIPIPLSDTPIVQKLINLFNLYKEVRLQKTKKPKHCLHSVKFIYMVYLSLTKTKVIYMHTLSKNDALLVSDIMGLVPTMGRWAIPIEILDADSQKDVCDTVREKIVDIRVGTRDSNLVLMIDDMLSSRMMQPNFFA